MEYLYQDEMVHTMRIVRLRLRAPCVRRWLLGGKLMHFARGEASDPAAWIARTPVSPRGDPGDGMFTPKPFQSYTRINSLYESVNSVLLRNRLRYMTQGALP